MEEPWAKVAELGKWLRSYKAEYRAKLDKAEEDCCKRCPGCCDVERAAQTEYEQRDLRTMNADL